MQAHKQINHQNLAYIKAAESYSIFVSDKGLSEIKSRPLKKYAQFLEEIGWCRIHRSYLVNPFFVKSIAEDRENIYIQNGAVLPISRRNLKAVLQWRNKI